MSTFITLDVSGHRYQTTKATLSTSPYFQNLFDRWDNGMDRAPDGSYFIDSKPEVFEHLLHFMRRPSKFPLFWTREKGFDYALYNKLEAEANYYLLQDLSSWIREGRYKDAVKTVIEIKKFPEPPPNGEVKEWKEVQDTQWFFDFFKDQKTYRCPLDMHDPASRNCGSRHEYSRCAELDKLHGPQYEGPDKYVVVLVKRTVFDDSVCRNMQSS